MAHYLIMNLFEKVSSNSVVKDSNEYSKNNEAHHNATGNRFHAVSCCSTVPVLLSNIIILH